MFRPVDGLLFVYLFCARKFVMCVCATVYILLCNMVGQIDARSDIYYFIHKDRNFIELIRLVVMPG